MRRVPECLHVVAGTPLRLARSQATIRLARKLAGRVGGARADSLDVEGEEMSSTAKKQLDEGKGGRKGKVMSVRLDAETYRRLKAYADSTGQPESTALRELCVRGLATDGLDLYSNEVGEYMRTVMQGVLSEMDALLARRNDEHEDRIARVVARSAKQASVASLACIDIVRGVFPKMREMRSEEVYARYSKRAGEMQAGKSFGEALRNAAKS